MAFMMHLVETLMNKQVRQWNLIHIENAEGFGDTNVHLALSLK